MKRRKEKEDENDESVQEESERSCDSKSNASCNNESSESKSDSSCLDNAKSDAELADHEELEKLAKKETERMRICRFVVIVLILCTGLGIASATYIYLFNVEYSNYMAGVRSDSEGNRSLAACKFLSNPSSLVLHLHGTHH